jgi:hypothetical protein
MLVKMALLCGEAIFVKMNSLIKYVVKVSDTFTDFFVVCV